MDTWGLFRVHQFEKASFASFLGVCGCVGVGRSLRVIWQLWLCLRLSFALEFQVCLGDLRVDLIDWLVDWLVG